ncbi:MAG: ribosome biogenesis GTPase Der [Patescibacteria group bacterium]|nr:ribosome biogenesis GTPase Der [Patescibacteria group bacterium]
MTSPAEIIKTEIPVVALVGRVNVGKSTLFNKIMGENKALVSDIAGTTRTRNIGIASWRGKNFQIIDTGGLTFSEDVPLEKEIIQQTKIALKDAGVIVFVADAQTGILPQEKELAKLLVKQKSKTIFVANKADNAKKAQEIYDPEWLKLNLGLPLPISAANGTGVGDLLDLIYKKFGQTSKRPKKSKEHNPIKVAIVGKPNVGKSSLFNSLIGEERVVVSPMPHTTREPHDTLVVFEKQPIVFVDTAGIRRKSRVSGELEVKGIGKSIESIHKAEIVIFVVDASESIANQDQQLAGFLREHAKSVIIVINKWDLAEENTDEFRNEAKKTMYAYFPHLDFAPIVFVSAKTQYRVHQIFPVIIRAAQERKTIIPEEDLKMFFKKITHEHLPARGKGTRHPKILGFKQIACDPPVFEMAIKAKTSVHISYVHYIENRLRENFSFFATPLIIKLRKVKR